jgi:hypothetical protein
MTNLEYVESLRKIADIYEHNLDLPMPAYEGKLNFFYVSSIEEAKNIIKKFGVPFKEKSDSFLKISTHCGTIKISAVLTNAEAQCEIIGTQKEIRKRPLIVDTIEEEVDVPIYKCPEIEGVL